LKQNNYFKLAIKVAVAIGDSANKDVLKEFTGSMEAVLETHNAMDLKEIIYQIVSSSMRIDGLIDKWDKSGGDILTELNTVVREIVGDAQTVPNSDQDDWLKQGI
jgi:hypothetical protein